MDCTRVKELMMDYLYQELPPAEMEEFKASLAHCPECAAELAAMTRTRQEFSALADVPAPEGSLAAIMAAARSQAPAARKSDDGFWARLWIGVSAHPALAAVASLVLVGGIAGFLTMTGRVSLTPAPMNDSAQAPSVAAPPATPGGRAPGSTEPGATEAMAAKNNEPAPTEALAGALGDGAGGAAEKTDTVNRRAKMAPESTRETLQAMPSKRGRATGIVNPAEGDLGRNQIFAKAPDAYGADAEASGGGALKGATATSDDGAAAAPKRKQAAPARPQAAEARDEQAEASAEPKDRAAPGAAAPAPSSAPTSDSKKESDTRSRAEELHRQAKAAAKVGDCERAVVLFVQIARVDAAYAKSSTNRSKDLGRCATVPAPTPTRKK